MALRLDVCQGGAAAVERGRGEREGEEVQAVNLFLALPCCIKNGWKVMLVYGII